MTEVHSAGGGTQFQPPVKVHARYLRAYFSDHLALSEGVGSLAERVRDASRWSEHRPRFEALVRALDEDRKDLERVLSERDISPDPLKRNLARLGERVGRLKGNGRLVRSSPLSRLMELEGLQLGLAGCEAPWTTLRDLGLDRERADAALTRLAGQHEVLERLRAEVARSSFTD